MEKQTAYLFRCLSTFVLLFYSVGVSSAPTSQNIIDVMKNDKDLCELPAFLFDNNVTKSCASLTYPKNDTQLQIYNANIFLCLGVYDALFKICNYSSHWQMPFNSSATFYSNLEKFFPGKKDADMNNFCMNISSVTPMYSKTKTLLSALIKHLSDTLNCHSICLGLDKEFNPLCAVLGWIKSVDDEMQKPLKNHDTDSFKDVAVQAATSKNKESGTTDQQANDSNSKTQSSKTMQTNSSPTTKLNSAGLGGNKKQPETPKNDIAQKIEGTSEKKEVITGSEVQMSNVKHKPSSITNANTSAKKDDSTIVDPAANSAQQSEPPVVHLPVSTGTENNHGKSEKSSVQKSDANTSSNSAMNSMKTLDQDVKTSTISQHTEDDPTNQEDYSRVEDEQSPYDNAGDNPDQSLNTGDQNPNIAEPAEQKEILPRYHSMSSDDESHFFTYFTVISLICVIMYIGYHNKQKILAIVLEGRRSRSNRSRRRPSTANYRKLDCTLEEAVTSQCNANVTHVIY